MNIVVANEVIDITSTKEEVNMKAIRCIKRFIALSVAVAVVGTISINAIDLEAIQKYEQLNPSTETMLRQMAEQMPRDEETLMNRGLITEASLGKTTVTRSVTTTTYFYATLNMPTLQFYIVATGLSEGDYVEAYYSSILCKKFQGTVNGENVIVYVARSAFDIDESPESSGVIPSSYAVLSTYLTGNLNSNNTDPEYSGEWRMLEYYGATAVQMVLYSTQAAYYEEDEIVLQHKIIASFGDEAFNVLNLDRSPTLSLRITHTGSGSRYLGAYYIKGQGKNKTTNDIADLIQFGYKTAQFIASAPTGLTTAAVAELLVDTVAFTGRGTSSSNYLSETVTLSNPGRNIYSYSCELMCPYELRAVNDVFTIHIGLLGSDGSSLRYQVNIEK